MELPIATAKKNSVSVEFDWKVSNTGKNWMKNLYTFLHICSELGEQTDQVKCIEDRNIKHRKMRTELYQ